MAEVRALASEYGPDAFKQLAELAGLARDDAGKRLPGASSETARISAIGMLLDRGFGKALPSRLVEIDLPDTDTPSGVAKAVAAVWRVTVSTARLSAIPDLHASAVIRSALKFESSL